MTGLVRWWFPGPCSRAVREGEVLGGRGLVEVAVEGGCDGVHHRCGEAAIKMQRQLPVFQKTCRREVLAGQLRKRRGNADQPPTGADSELVEYPGAMPIYWNSLRHSHVR